MNLCQLCAFEFEGLFLKQRLRELFGVEGLQIVRLLDGFHFVCLNFSSSLNNGDQ